MLRGRAEWIGAIAALGAVTVLALALGGAPDVLAPAPAPPVTTRPLSPEPVLTRLSEDGLPVLAAEQAEPRVFTFTRVSAPVRLLPAAETVLRSGSEAILRLDAVQRIMIPRIHLDSDVIAVEVVGQYRGADPGAGSNVVLAGHVGTRNNVAGAVFRDLHKQDVGDRIALETEGAEFAYVVTEVRLVSPQATYLMEPTASEQLTLITCRSCNTGCKRLVVIAEPAPQVENA